MPPHSESMSCDSAANLASMPSDRYRNSCVAFNLRRASRVVTRRYEEALRPLGMKAFQFTALAALSGRKEMPLSAVAEHFGMDLSTASRNLKAMNRKGWLEIKQDPGNRRRRNVSATAEGRRAFQDAVPLWEEAQKDTTKLMEGFQWELHREWLASVSVTR